MDRVFIARSPALKCLWINKCNLSDAWQLFMTFNCWNWICSTFSSPPCFDGVSRWQINNERRFLKLSIKAFHWTSSESHPTHIIKLLLTKPPPNIKARSLKSFDYSSQWLIEKLKSNCITPTKCNNKEASRDFSVTTTPIRDNWPDISKKSEFHKTFKRSRKKRFCWTFRFKSFPLKEIVLLPWIVTLYLLIRTFPSSTRQLLECNRQINMLRNGVGQ